MSAFQRLRAGILRLLGLFSRERREREFAEEMEAHLQLQIDANMRAGMSAQQARREALVTSGGVEQARQSYRERLSAPLLLDLWQDLRYSFRKLSKSLGFAVTSIAMLGLGMGASVAIFSFVDAALLKPLPYRDPARLVAVNESVKLFPRANISYPDYLDWKRMNTVFSSLDMYTGGGYLLNTSSGSVPVDAARVSDGFFRTLGVKPMLGRDFYAGEDLPQAAATVMLTYGSWKARFNSRRDIVGQTLLLNGAATMVIGVLPPEFQFAPRGSAEFYTPFRGKSGCDVQRGCHSLDGVARLKDGVSISAAMAEMQTIAAQLEKQYPDTNRGQGALVEPMAAIIIGDIRPILLTLLIGAGLLMMIACVNVASLLLVRSESRRREFALRGALGASRTRLIRQLITEAAVLVVLGSALGLGLAAMAIRVLLSLVPKRMQLNMPFLSGIEIHGHALMLAGAIALLAILLFAVTPMLRLPARGLRDGFHEGGRPAAGTVWRRLGHNLVMLELAIAVVLLVGAGLLGRSLQRLLHVEVNFDTDHLATMQVIAPETRFTKDAELVTLQQEIVRRVSALPGVESVGLTSVLPVSCNCNTDWIRFVGKPYNGQHNEVNLRDVNGDFFKTLHAKLIAGRWFDEREDSTKPKVVIINRALAREYYPGEDPIGKKIGGITLAPDSIKTIVGIVDDIHEGSLESPIWPAVYYPYNQGPDNYYSLIVRTSGDAAALLPDMVRAVHSVDPDVGTAVTETMDQLIHDSQTAYLHRSSAWLVGGFAALALLLGVVGIYGVIAYSVSQRTREIGVRMALGAQRGSVYGMVMREAGRLTAVGIGIGLIGSVGAGMLMRKLLFGTAAWDAATLASVAGMLALSALVASYVPAHRAASVNPVDALRAE